MHTPMRIKRGHLARNAGETPAFPVLLWEADSSAGQAFE